MVCQVACCVVLKTLLLLCDGSEEDFGLQLRQLKLGAPRQGPVDFVVVPFDCYGCFLLTESVWTEEITAPDSQFLQV